MDVDALRFANFSKLDAAITDWEEMVKKLKTLSDDADHNLKAKADRASWAGVNAQVTREFIDKTAGEFNDAHTQANTIARILRDTYDELVTHRRRLNEAIEQGLKKNLRVNDTGHGTFTVTQNVLDPNHVAGDKHASQQDRENIENLRDEVQTILKNATTSDRTAAEALRLIVDQAKCGFSDVDYKDRDSAAAAIKAADDMAALLKKNPHDLTHTELAQLNKTLTQYHADPLFAEQFAEKVGPRHVLELWAAVAAPGMPGSTTKDDELTKDLQKSLGLTLATATQSDSADMENWENKMVGLGTQRLGIDDAGDPYGAQVMSNLMRFGDYDDQFLNAYGNKLIAFDKEHNGTQGLNFWVNGTNPYDLNYWGKNDQGRDPMTGFLEALGHNPDASTQFFAQPEGAGKSVDRTSEINDHLEYLVKERNWVADTTVGDSGKYIAGRDALGHALEAATTGYAYDAPIVTHHGSMVPGAMDHRTAATAGVMEQVAYLYGSVDGTKLLHHQPELADSLGKMASAYIDDIDHDLSGLSDYARDETNFPARYAGRAEFTNQGAINFMSVLGQNQTSHALVSSAQHLYTLSLLDANPPTDHPSYEHGKAALMMEAEARGILDHSRVQQAAADFGQNSEAQNKSLGRSAEWIKLATGTAVGVGVAAIPVPGSTIAGVAIIPIATEKAGEVADTFIGQAIDKGVDGREQDPTEQAQMTSVRFYQKGVDDLGSSYARYADMYAKHGGNPERSDLDALKGQYTSTGSGEDDLRGLPPYKGD